MTGFMPKSSFASFPVLPPSTTFIVTMANPPRLIMKEQFFLGVVKIAAAIISLMFLIAALCKYRRNYSSSAGTTVAGSSFTNTGGDVVVQVQLPAPNMMDSSLDLV
ncbi:hypothetical protein CMV_027682 [Castanea mollissima]|uniref:Transmembrane protein n=1 Tax=Castanea mollissima TaxID=60419 RepID=A0A8J4VEV1_9ROSI|nr:hypothetical protein CMV_027682 [Castanea mollissima]